MNQYQKGQLDGQIQAHLEWLKFMEQRELDAAKFNGNMSIELQTFIAKCIDMAHAKYNKLDRLR